MDLHQQRASLLKIAIPVLLGSTWMFFAFVMDTRPAANRPTGAIDRLARLPASLSAGEPLVPAKVLEAPRMDVVRLPCWDQSAVKEMAVSARWVRVVGRNCNSEGATVSVRNLANANVATVLPEAKGQITTDFIPIESGRNDILFTFESAPGKILERRVTLIR